MQTYIYKKYCYAGFVGYIGSAFPCETQNQQIYSQQHEKLHDCP